MGPLSGLIVYKCLFLYIVPITLSLGLVILSSLEVLRIKPPSGLVIHHISKIVAKESLVGTSYCECVFLAGIPTISLKSGF